VLNFYCPVQSEVEQVEAAQCQHRLREDQFPEVMVDVVAEFMREYNFNLVRRVAVQHGIAKHDAARVAQAHQSGIGGCGFRAQMHGEDAAHTGMGAVSQRQQPLRQLAFGQRSELIENWQDEHRSEVCHHDSKEEHDKRNPEPPGLRLGRQQEIDQLDGKNLQDEAQYKPLEEISQPASQGHGGKPVTMG